MIFFILFICFVVAVIYLLSNKSKTTSPSVKSFIPIPDKYRTYEQLHAGLREAGLESCNLIVGIDFTKSNLWTGKNTFGGLSLHSLSSTILNPYQCVINILGRTLEAFDDDNLIPVYGFGDAITKDKAVFSLNSNLPCQGFQDALRCYNIVTPLVQLSGPTSFTPIIHKAIEIVKKDYSYHILVIIADGQVTDEKETAKAIIECSKYPISIILIGVGDGPWKAMEEFDDGLPQRQFDNFQFVNFHELMTKYDGDELVFAMNAMMEIPDQYKCIKELGLMRNPSSNRLYT